MIKGVLLVLLLCTSSILAWTSTEFVNAHNSVRANPGQAPATPLTNLTWSTQLATTAQNYANGCPTTCTGHNPNRSVGYEPNYVGENIYWITGTSIPSNIASSSVSSWDSERQYYNYQTGACTSGQQCGHFTQLVWDDTTQVGCGVTACSPSSCSSFFGPSYSFVVVVCNYLIGGNWVGQLPYDLSVPSISPSISLTPSITPTPSISASKPPSASSAASTTPSLTSAASPSATSAVSTTPSASAAASVSPSISVTSAPSASPSANAAPSNSPTGTPTSSTSRSNTPSGTPAASSSPTNSISLSNTQTSTATPTNSPTPAASVSPSRSSACGACDPNATCQSGSCVCNSGYSGNGQTCTVIGQSVPYFLLDWSVVRGSSNFFIPSTSMNLPTSNTSPQWLRWIHADPVFVGSTQYTFGANIFAASGDVAFGLRYSQSGSSRAKDAAIWIGRINPATSQISFYFCFAYYAPNSYSCSFGTPYGTRAWNTTGFNSFSVQITDVNGYLYMSPKLNKANAIDYSALYIDRNYYPSTGGAVLIANNTNYVEWNTVFIQTESTILMTLTACMTPSAVKDLVASTLGISTSQITATASSVDSSNCTSKRSVNNVEEAAAGSYVVTLSGDSTMVAQAMSSKLTALSQQGALPGVSSVAATAPANLAEITSTAFAAAAPTAGVVAPVAGGLAAAGGGGGGAAGLSSGAIIGITLGSVTVALLAVGVAAAVIAAIVVAASKKREQRDPDEYPSSSSSRRPQSEIEIAALEAAANEEEAQGFTHAVRKTIYNIFRAPKGGVDVTGPKGHQSITARAPAMNN